jgi:MerR family transcriptional regulator, light-induced transcriptional regulator
MANYSIRDLERLTGIKAHTIRIWEKRYGLIEPERTSTNIRAYCDAELKKLLNISILNRNGVKISKIARLSQEEIAENINSLVQNSTDTESYLENLAIAMIDLDENKFERILTRAIIQIGFEDTVIKILNPFFIRIGIMWQTGSINPAQEHFVSNLVRQKMMVAIDSQTSSDSLHSKSFVLFLPEGEMHELGLLFANYLIRKRGHRVIYLGQNVPLNDLIEIHKIRSIDYMYTSFVTSMTECDILHYLSGIAQSLPGETIYVTGEQALSLKEQYPSSVKYISSPQELINELNLLATL